MVDGFGQPAGEAGHAVVGALLGLTYGSLPVMSGGAGTNTDGVAARAPAWWVAR